MANGRAPTLDVNEAIGERIRRRRIDIGVSQAELAARIGLSFQQVQKYERGASRIASETLLEIAQALDCPPTVLLGISDVLPPEHEWLLSALADEQTSRIIKRFSEIKSSRVRLRVMTILEALLNEDGVTKALGERQRAPKRVTTSKAKRSTKSKT